MLVGEFFALVGLAAGFFFFIFAAKYYGAILFVLIGKNKIENRLNWRNFNNHNGRNGNGNHNGLNGLNGFNGANGLKTAPNGGMVKTAYNGGSPTTLIDFYTTRDAIAFAMGEIGRNARELTRTSFPLWANDLWSHWGKLGATLRWKINPGIRLFEQNHGIAHNGGGTGHLTPSHQINGVVSFKLEGPFRKTREFLWATSPPWLRKAWKAIGEGVRSITSTRIQLFGRGNGVGNNNHYGSGNGVQNGKINGNGNGNGNGNNKPAPFVSIHLPFYNEKNVADRILTACTSLDYPNYEVIVADDSTDETVELLEKWKAHPRVKVLHRAVRRGWKGGALNEALKHMDPRTEYVVVFDADFIPPPDIIQQFLPYFTPQVTGNGNGNGNNHNGNNHYTNGNGNGNNHAYPNNNHRTINKNDYQRIISKLESWYEQRELAVIQGYQWHYLNAGENWLTRGIRAEYSSSYVIERTCQQLAGAMKMISGSVFMIKADVLKKHGWSHSMTEDWELTLRLYIDGYKVAYTPYIQAPAECPSTIPQLMKQRMRWAEGHTYNAKKYFWEVLRSKRISLREKLEFIYFAPYYIQSFIFLIGTAFWFLSEAMHQYLPFWTQVFGWSLLLSNLLSLPLMGLTGLFLEKNVRKDLTGLFSVIVMSYVLVPFQAYASLKGLLEEKERGTWIRTLKTGKITEALKKLEFRRVWRELLPRRRQKKVAKKVPVATKTAANGGALTEQSKKEGKDQPEQNAENNPRLNHKLSLFNGDKKPVALILLLVMSGTILGTVALGTTLSFAPVHALGSNRWYLSATPSDHTPSGATASYTFYEDSGWASACTLYGGTVQKYYYWYSEWTYPTSPGITAQTWTLTFEWTSRSTNMRNTDWYFNVYWALQSSPTTLNKLTATAGTWNLGTGSSGTKTATASGSSASPSGIYHIILEIIPPITAKDSDNLVTGTTSNLYYPGTTLPENSIVLILFTPLIPVFWANRKRKTSSKARVIETNEMKVKTERERVYFDSKRY